MDYKDIVYAALANPIAAQAVSKETAHLWMLAVAMLLLVGPIVMPLLIFATTSTVRASIAFVIRAWHVVTDKIVEILLIILLAWMAGIPMLGDAAALLLGIFKH